MEKVVRVDPTRFRFDILRDLTVDAVEQKPGLPERIDGMTLGIITMEDDAPHGGEIHPDGDEILYVISGRISVSCDSHPDDPVELTPGQACIVRKGEWHKVSILEKTQLIHVTPGPNGDHRPL